MGDRNENKENFISTQWMLVSAILFVIGGGLIWSLCVQYNAIDMQERGRLEIQAKVIDENLENQLLAVNFVLDSIRRDCPDPMTHRYRRSIGTQRLQDMKTAMPLVFSLLVLNADGTVLVSNNERLIGLNFKHREYFQLARQALDPTILHVGQPFDSVMGVFAIPLAKVILDKQNAFAGVVLALIDTTAFNTLMLSVRYASDMWTALAHGDGAFITMLPMRDELRGRNLAKPGSFFTRHVESGEKATVLTGIVYATAEERMMASHTIRPTSLNMDKPLILGVSRDLPSIFASWYREAIIHGFVFIVLVLFACLGLYFYQQRKLVSERLAFNQEAERERKRKDDMRFRAMVETSTDWIWEVDGNANYTYVSPRVAEMLGYTPAEVIGRAPFEFMAPDEAARVGTIFAGIAATCQPFQLLENTCLHKDGHRVVVETSGTPLFDVTGKCIGYHGADRDITERKRTEVELLSYREHLEEEVRLRTQELERAKRDAESANVAKSEFLANMSHEFRTPLAAMMGVASLVRHAGVTDKQAHWLDAHEISSNRMLEMIKNILDLIRLDAGDVTLAQKDFVLDELLSKALAEIGNKARAKGLELAIFNKAAPQGLHGDPSLLQQALMNYLSNAIKFTESGSIDVTVNLLEETQDGYLLHFAVRDTGVGITPEQQAHIFNIFEQGDNSSTRRFGGVGLGLVVTQRIAKLMGGDVGAESVFGVGSTFWFTARVLKGCKY